MKPRHPLKTLLWLHDQRILPPATVDVLLDEHLSAVGARSLTRHPAVFQDFAEEAENEEISFVTDVLARAPQLEVDLRRAAADYRDLMRLEANEQQEVVAKARSRYNSAVLVAKLLDHCRAVVHEDPEEAESCARLAGMVAYRAEDLLLEPLCRALLGNAVRVRGDLAEADAHFAEVRRLLRLAPFDSLTSAECDSLEASLRRDQRQFEEARMLLERATLVFASLGLVHREAVVRLNRAEVARLSDAADAAVTEVVQCLDLLDPRRVPKLHLFALHALALSLLSAGRLAESTELLDLVAPLFERQGSELLRLRFVWLEGRVAAKRGDLEKAEDRLQAAVAGFAAQRFVLAAAVVALDLAEVLLSQGRSAAVRGFARSLARIFREKRLEGEMAQVVRLLWQAAAQDKLTTSLIQALRARATFAAGS